MSTSATVAVSQRVDVLPGRRERRDALDQRLSAFLTEAGLLPVPVPNSFTQIATFYNWFNRINPQGIILSGGNDIGQCPDRDQVERWLLCIATELELPILGICRGMQFLAHSACGELKKAAGHVANRHVLELMPNVGIWPQEVNSFHDWTLVACPTGYRVAAKSTDGAIEAIVHDFLPREGWMWHPERETTFSTIDIARVRKLFLR